MQLSGQRGRSRPPAQGELVSWCASFHIRLMETELEAGWLVRGLDRAEKEIQAWPKARREMLAASADFAISPISEGRVGAEERDAMSGDVDEARAHGREGSR